MSIINKVIVQHATSYQTHNTTKPTITLIMLIMLVHGATNFILIVYAILGLGIYNIYEIHNTRLNAQIIHNVSLFNQLISQAQIRNMILQNYSTFYIGGILYAKLVEHLHHQCDYNILYGQQNRNIKFPTKQIEEWEQECKLYLSQNNNASKTLDHLVNRTTIHLQDTLDNIENIIPTLYQPGIHRHKQCHLNFAIQIPVLLRLQQYKQIETYYNRLVNNTYVCHFLQVLYQAFLTLKKVNT